MALLFRGCRLADRFLCGQKNENVCLCHWTCGARKKLLIIFVAIGFHGVDQILDMPFIGVWAVGALAINELISILENIERAGHGSIIPKYIREMLDIVRREQENKIKSKLPIGDKNE